MIFSLETQTPLLPECVAFFPLRLECFLSFIWIQHLAVLLVGTDRWLWFGYGQAAQKEVNKSPACQRLPEWCDSVSERISFATRVAPFIARWSQWVNSSSKSLSWDEKLAWQIAVCLETGGCLMRIGSRIWAPVHHTVLFSLARLLLCFKIELLQYCATMLIKRNSRHLIRNLSSNMRHVFVRLVISLNENSKT